MEKELVLRGVSTVEELVDKINNVAFEEKLLTITQATEELSVSKRQFKRLIDSGDLKVRGAGTLKRVLRSELYDCFKHIKSA